MQLTIDYVRSALPVARMRAIPISPLMRIRCFLVVKSKPIARSFSSTNDQHLQASDFVSETLS
jgi:hypothetical protein